MSYENFTEDFFNGASLVGLPLLSFQQSIEFLFQHAHLLGSFSDREREFLPRVWQNPGDALRESLNPSMTSALQNACQHLKKRFAPGRLHAMTLDEVAAINLYTQETVLYHIMNRLLGAKNGDLIPPFLPYIKLLLTALYKLPAVTAHVDRGVAICVDDLDEQYGKGDLVTWWRFSSTTRTIGTLEDFLDRGADGTIFTVDILTGVDIKSFSSNDEEDEVLLLPGTTYRVHSTVVLAESASMQLTMAQLKETQDGGRLGYTREDFQQEYVAQQIPDWCCRPCLYVSTLGWLPVQHPLLAERLQQHYEFRIQSESQPCGPSIWSRIWMLIVEFLKSFWQQLRRAILIIMFVFLGLYLSVLVVEAHMSFPDTKNWIREHPRTSIAVAVSFAFVVIPCVQCYYVSQYRGCWDVRRGFYRRSLEMQLRRQVGVGMPDQAAGLMEM
mmetsp:Transcript_150539/g.274006  ORF Transcript_150539/g.274006 Transcript_150539/m.274006 type:complete len:441 (+) Transcript_150539:71-1393(+)